MSSWGIQFNIKRWRMLWFLGSQEVFFVHVYAGGKSVY